MRDPIVAVVVLSGDSRIGDGTEWRIKLVRDDTDLSAGTAYFDGYSWDVEVLVSFPWPMKKSASAYHLAGDDRMYDALCDYAPEDVVDDFIGAALRFQRRGMAG
jgi:hypothetical protein